MSEEGHFKTMGSLAQMSIRIIDDLRERGIPIPSFMGNNVAKIESLYDQAIETGKASEEDVDAALERYRSLCTSYVWLTLGGED